MTNMKRALLMCRDDSVAMVLSKVEKNERIVIMYENTIVDTIESLDTIDIYHKVAVRLLQEKKYVYKYGEKIGSAVKDIEKGRHVHVDNIEGVNIKNENKSI